MDYNLKLVNGTYKLQPSGETIQEGDGLKFIAKIKDHFYDQEFFSQDSHFNKEVIQQVQTIAVDCGVLNTNDKRQMGAFKNFCPAVFHLYKCASVERSVSALCFVYLVCFLDDLLDDEELSEETAEEIVNNVCSTFKDGEVNSSISSKQTEDILKYTLEVRKRLLLHVDEEWMSKFSESYTQYLTASLNETLTDETMPIDEYLKIRMYTSSAFLCQDLLSVMYNFSYKKSQDIERARFLCNRVMSFTNDLFSFEKECNSNSANLLKLLMIEEEIPLSHASNKVLDMLNQDIDELRMIEQQTAGTEDWITKCVEGIKIMIQGHTIWCGSTKRYCTSTSPFVDLREQHAKISCV
ncbi:Npun [Acrasis kona]|uniref:Terpene synthase n=1 Tax=Acrasis kona TaxID=1008807 RepID=A0AAW2YHL6_9EUKA